MTDEQLMKLALKNSCTPYGKADPGTYSFIEGYKTKEAELRLPNFHSVIANTPDEVKAEVKQMMDDLDKENKPSLLFYCQSAKDGDIHCITQCETCKLKSIPSNKERYLPELIVEEYFGFPDTMSETSEVKTDYGQLVGLVCLAIEKYSSPPIKDNVSDGITKMYSQLAADAVTLSASGFKNIEGYGDCLWDFKVLAKDLFGIELPKVEIPLPPKQ